MKATPSHQEGWLASTISGAPAAAPAACPSAARAARPCCARKMRAKTTWKKAKSRASRSATGDGRRVPLRRRGASLSATRRPRAQQRVARAGASAASPMPRPPAVLVQRVRRDPAGHHHHRHARPRMRGAAGEVEALHAARAVARLEGAEEGAVRGEAVDRAVQHLVALVDVLRRQRALDHDALLDVLQAGGALELVEDHLAVGGEHPRPVLAGAQMRRVDQHVERLAALRAPPTGRCPRARRGRRWGRGRGRPSCRWRRTPPPRRGRRRSRGGRGGRSACSARDRARRRSRPARSPCARSLRAVLPPTSSL